MRTSKLSILFALLILLGISTQTARATGAESLDSVDSTLRPEESAVQPVAPMPTSTTVSSGLARYQGWHFGVLMGLGGAWMKFEGPAAAYSTQSSFHFRFGALLTGGSQISSNVLLEGVAGLTLSRVGGSIADQQMGLFRFDIPAHLNLLLGVGSAAMVAGIGLESSTGFSSTPAGAYGANGVLNSFDLAFSVQFGFRYKVFQATYFYSHGLLNQSKLQGTVDFELNGRRGRGDLSSVKIYNASTGVAVAFIF